MKVLILLLSLTFIPVSVSAKAQTHEVKLLTYNTWMIPVLRKMAKARAEAIGRELGQYDIALMQEAFTSGVRKTMATLARQFDLDNRYQARPFFRINSGSFTFTRYEIVKSDFMRFLNCRGIQCLSARGVLYVQVKLPNGQLLDLFNTHLQAFEKHAKVRKRQMKRVMKFVNKKNDGTIPVIFGGDFNVIGETEEYQQLLKMLGNFKDVWTELRPNEPGLTWDPSVNTWAEYDYEESQLYQRLDYIFYRDGKQAKIKIKDVSLAFDTQKIWYGVYKSPNYIFASDHFGVETTFTVETQELN
jgi:endonuclease/exonuclease/phosphatase family metal-dependent hydrolase